MGKVLPNQRLLKQFEERLVFGETNLSEIVQSGAQMTLQYALEREVMAQVPQVRENENARLNVGWPSALKRREPSSTPPLAHHDR